MSEGLGFSGVVAAALEISKRRAEILGRMKAALERDDTDEVIQCAKKLCGIEDKRMGLKSSNQESRKRARKGSKK